MRRVTYGLLLVLYGWLLPVAAGRLAAGPATETPAPPFRKVWRTQSQEQCDSFVVTANTVYYGTLNAYGAIDLRTGRRRWERKFSEPLFDASVALGGRTLYVGIGKGRLLACDPATGREQWSLRLRDYAYPMRTRGQTLYCTLKPGVLTALDTRTRAARWSLPLPGSPSAARRAGRDDLALASAPLAESNRIYVASNVGAMLCADTATGAVLWRSQADAATPAGIIGLALDAQRVYYGTDDGQVIARDSASGRRLWTYRAGERISGVPALLAGGVCVSASDGKLRVLNAGDGTVRWEAVLSHEREPYISPPCVRREQVWVTSGAKVMAFGADGARRWEWDTEEDLFAQPLHVLPDGMLLAGSHTFTRFVQGEPPTLPTDPAARQALAAKLTARFDSLSQDEQRTLRKLGDEAFAALLPLVRERLTRCVAEVKQGSKSAFQSYSRFSDAAEALDAVMQPKQTQAVMALLPLSRTPGPDDSAYATLLGLLEAHGDERLTVPLFLNVIRASRADTSYLYSAYSTALRVLANSSDPRAVRYMIAQLADEKAEPERRHQAYINLARTGGEAGLQAVLAARDTRRTVPPFRQMLALDRLGLKPDSKKRYPSQLLATRRDGQGRLWGLVASPILGSGGDLWLVRHDGTRWVDPVFTGVDIIEQGFWRRDDRPFRYQGLTRKQLLDGAWFAKFVGSAALRKDTDGDGWTDLVEQRLGTDPTKADSDGDGLPDGQDKNPLAAPRPLTEAEQVLAAAFEARYRFEGPLVPCALTWPKGVAPIEVRGWDGIVLPQSAQRRSNLSWLYGKGVGLVHFEPPTYDFSGGAVHERREDAVILWNSARTEAKTAISTYYGGLSGTVYDMRLKKFGAQWVVIEEKMTIIS
jgi:outer membrane protein assembly factor BamB